MKQNNFYFGFMALIFIAFFINKPKVPKLVLEAFAEKYPNAKKIEWEQEEEDIFEVEFKINKQEMTAEFKKDGTWISTETEIKRKDLPNKIKAAINDKYPGFKIEEPELIELPNGNFQYEAEVEKGKKEFEVIFDSTGKFISELVEND